MAEFNTILLDNALEQVAEEHLFGPEAVAFGDDGALADLFAEHIKARLEDPDAEIVVIGSAKIGFSLNPHNFPRVFSDESDIDVAVISPALFDMVWHTILTWHYPSRTLRLAAPDRKWALRRGVELYWGWFRPHHIRFDGLSFPKVLIPARDVAAKWFDAFQSLSLLPEFAGRIVTGRLYRSKQHALLYHVDGLRRIKELVQTHAIGD